MKMKIWKLIVIFCAFNQFANAQQPRASYLAFEAVGVNATDFGYRPSIGFRASGNFMLPKELYLREEIETATEFKISPPVSGEGRYFASRTTIEKDIAEPSTETAIAAIGGLDIAHFGNDLYKKTAVRASVGVSGRWNNSDTRMPRVEGSVAIIIPLHDQNKLWGGNAKLSGFYDIPHSFIGITGGVDVLVANAKDSFTPRRGWGEVFSAHAGITINLSAINGY